MLEFIGVLAVAVVCASIIVLTVFAIGEALLSPREERELMLERRVWREKRRELNASVRARNVR